MQAYTEEILPRTLASKTHTERIIGNYFPQVSYKRLVPPCLVHVCRKLFNSVTGGVVRVSPGSFDHGHYISCGGTAVGNWAEGRRVPLHVLH